jgi:hypothetical protein
MAQAKSVAKSAKKRSCFMLLSLLEVVDDKPQPTLEAL